MWAVSISLRVRGDMIMGTPLLDVCGTAADHYTDIAMA